MSCHLGANAEAEGNASLDNLRIILPNQPKFFTWTAPRSVACRLPRGVWAKMVRRFNTAGIDIIADLGHPGSCLPGTHTCSPCPLKHHHNMSSLSFAVLASARYLWCLLSRCYLRRRPTQYNHDKWRRCVWYERMVVHRRHACLCRFGATVPPYASMQPIVRAIPA